MRKILLGAVTLMIMCAAQVQTASAQAATPNKFGYFDIDYLVSLMPGVEKLDSIMQRFAQDSLNPEYEDELRELRYTDSLLRADSAKMPARLYQQRQQEQAQRYFKLQNWQEYSQQTMQMKQQELLAPFYQKVADAFKKVVTEGKYTYVFKQDSLYEAPPGDNLVPLVAKKLGIKLPDPNTSPQR